MKREADSLLTAGRVALRAAFSGLLVANHRPADGCGTQSNHLAPNRTGAKGLLSKPGGPACARQGRKSALGETSEEQSRRLHAEPVGDQADNRQG